MHLLLKALTQVTNNRFAQDGLSKAVAGLQFLRGIGSGGSVKSSGEGAVFELVYQKSAVPYCIFDVGANHGQYLAEASTAFLHQELTIHCFEPSQDSFALLQANIPNRNNHQVILNNIALGKEQGEATLWSNTPGSSMASLTKRRLDHYQLAFDNAETVYIDTIDNYCSNRRIKVIDLLKIDIEGHELNALEGASQMFEQKAIKIVTFEFGGCNIDTRTYFQDYYYFFRQRGMKILRITPSGYLHPIEQYNEGLEQFKAANFVAVQGA